MSRENVEVVQALFAAWNEGDIEGVLATLHPDVSFQTSGVYPGLDPLYLRHEGFRKFWRDFRGAWDNLGINVARLSGQGERVLALYTFEATAREGMEVSRHGGNVITFEAHLAKHIDSFGDWKLALQAAGLSE